MSASEEWLSSYIRGGYAVYIPASSIVLTKEEIDYIAEKEKIPKQKASKLYNITLAQLEKQAIQEEQKNPGSKNNIASRILRHLWWMARYGGEPKLAQHLKRIKITQPPTCTYKGTPTKCPKNAPIEGLAYAIQRACFKAGKQLEKQGIRNHQLCRISYPKG